MRLILAQRKEQTPSPLLRNGGGSLSFCLECVNSKMWEETDTHIFPCSKQLALGSVHARRSSVACA